MQRRTISTSLNGQGTTGIGITVLTLFTHLLALSLQKIYIWAVSCDIWTIWLTLCICSVTFHPARNGQHTQSRFAVAISADVGLRVGLPRHMHNQFFVHTVDSGHSLGSDCVHCTSVGYPESITYSTSNPLCIDAGGHMCYLRQPQALCVHCSDVPLTGLDELCSSALLWLCLTTLHFNFYMFSSRHGVDLACMLKRCCLIGVSQLVACTLL